MAIQLASKSVGKSIPLICHKVEKPNELKNFNTAALLGDYSTA